MARAILVSACPLHEDALCVVNHAGHHTKPTAELDQMDAAALEQWWTEIAEPGTPRWAASSLAVLNDGGP